MYCRKYFFSSGCNKPPPISLPLNTTTIDAIEEDKNCTTPSVSGSAGVAAAPPTPEQPPCQKTLSQPNPQDCLLSNPGGFMLGIIGKPGSGKSTLIKSLLTTVLRAKYSYVLVLSPSNEEYESFVPETQRTSDFDITWITKMINLINLSSAKTKQTNILIIIDDNVAKVKEVERKAATSKLFFNRRHMLWNGTISLILVSQKYTMVPARYRSCFTHLAIYTTSPFDVKKIFDESIFKYSKAEWTDKVAHLYDTPYNYLFINLETQNASIVSQEIKPLFAVNLIA